MGAGEGMDLRPLGSTGIEVSPVGLGTVKFGRNQGVKYPTRFAIPDDCQLRSLLGFAQALGLNLLDTAPAYGQSEERLGKLLPGRREDWVIVSKVGESFADGESTFDFSARGTRRSVERSLRLLGTDYLDAVLIHSNGDDRRILEQEEVLGTLYRLKEVGMIRAHGMSSKTVTGGLLTVQLCDLVMATCNPLHREEIPVLESAQAHNKGVLIKKALQSGQLRGEHGVADALRFVFSQPGVSSVIIGTIDADHLRYNVAAAEAALREQP